MKKGDLLFWMVLTTIVVFGITANFEHDSFDGTLALLSFLCGCLYSIVTACLIIDATRDGKNK